MKLNPMLATSMSWLLLCAMELWPQRVSGEINLIDLKGEKHPTWKVRRSFAGPF